MSLMISEPTLRFKNGSADKLRGGYYTPPSIADWLSDWAIRDATDTVLEPSCGNGVFLSAAARRLGCLGASERAVARQILGIEINAEESRKSLAQLAERNCAADNVHCVDFFEWLMSRHARTFDCVVGNPPFLRYQNFPDVSRALAMGMMERFGLRPNRLTNIWVPFVVGAISCMKEGGRLAMVLPAELLQVSYAAQLRQFVVDSFDRVTVFTCNEMFFDNAEQEVVLLAAEGKCGRRSGQHVCDITVIGTPNTRELLKRKPAVHRKHSEPKFVNHDTEKWLKYLLDAREIDLMRSLRRHPAVTTLDQHATVDIGIVTGRNEFFVLSQAEVERFRLARFVVPLVGRSAQLAGAVLRKSEHDELGRAGKRVYLLHLTGRSAGEFPPELHALIADGEKKNFHSGFKCSIRNPWYNVPAVWEPDCFLFRQIYDFPRVVVNMAKATSTDTIHRMRCRGTPARLTENLYTHLTAASSEIEGRSYGGGVLELEPTEAENLLVPRNLAKAMPVADVDKLVRGGKLAQVLDHNDGAVLQGKVGLDKSDCRTLKEIWTRMRERRRSRSRN